MARGFEDAPGAGDARGVYVGCAVTSRPISAAILDYLVAPAGRGDFSIDPMPSLHIFHCKFEIV